MYIFAILEILAIIRLINAILVLKHEYLHCTLWESIEIPDTIKERCIDEHNADIVNMIKYVAYVCNNFFLHFSYASYPKLSLTIMITMTNDIPSWKQFCPRKI